VSISEERVCPYLGAMNGPDTYWPQPSPANRCYAFPAPTPITEDEQERLCLSGEFGRCPRLQAAQMAYGQRYPAPARPRARIWPWQTHPMAVIVGGLITMGILLVCAWALVAYQTRGFRPASAFATATPLPALTATAPVGTPVSSPTMPAPPTDTPTTIPTDTPIPSPTFTAVIIPTLPVETPTPWPTPTPFPTPVPRPTNTPRPTFTRPPTFTPRPTYTASPTRTVTPTRTPTVVQYAIQLIASATSAQVQAGQTATFNVTVRNMATVPDTVALQLFPAVMSGWSVRLIVDGADKGAGPVTIALAASGTKTVSVTFTVPADAAVGSAGEAYLSAASQSSATAQASLSLTVSVKE
jgi:hypothetical protein